MNLKSFIATGVAGLGLLLSMLAMPLPSKAMATEISTEANPTTTLVAQEKHPNMRAAKRNLEMAREDLRKASHDYNGKRAESIELINRAIRLIDEGIEQDNH